jgi:hypothetical protein
MLASGRIATRYRYGTNSTRDLRDSLTGMTSDVLQAGPEPRPTNRTCGPFSARPTGWRSAGPKGTFSEQGHGTREGIPCKCHGLRRYLTASKLTWP